MAGAGARRGDLKDRVTTQARTVSPLNPDVPDTPAIGDRFADLALSTVDRIGLGSEGPFEARHDLVLHQVEVVHPRIVLIDKVEAHSNQGTKSASLMNQICGLLSYSFR